MARRVSYTRIPGTRIYLGEEGGAQKFRREAVHSSGDAHTYSTGTILRYSESVGGMPKHHPPTPSLLPFLLPSTYADLMRLVYIPPGT